MDKWIRGKNVSVGIVTDSSPQTIENIGCSRTCTLVTNVETAPKSTLGSGLWKEFKAIVNGWSVSVEGLATVGANMSISDLRTLQFTLEPVIVSFQEISESTTINYAGFAIVTSVSVSGNFADAETYNVEFLGTGELLQDAESIYGNYPDLFQIIAEDPDTPDPGETTLSFVWNAASPLPNTYNVKIIDLTTNTTTYQTVSAAFNTMDIIVNSDDSYAFEIQSIYTGLGSSLFSPQIFWP